ncbi:MAG: hypothetical protein MZV64_31485 [Ignavibacteriales bacterium]|nr:hypothetical protein [Ignavibacteriales bacterium]
MAPVLCRCTRPTRRGPASMRPWGTVRASTRSAAISPPPSGSEGPRGYRVSSDVSRRYRALPQRRPPPAITPHRRNPVVVAPDSSARISVRVTQQSGGSLPKTVSLYYSVNYLAFTQLAMNYQASDTTYVATIPQQTTNTAVRYFVAAADSFGQTVRLANSAASGGIASDTSKGFFFYTSLVRALTIQDVQTTPYVNGRTPYLGARGLAVRDHHGRYHPDLPVPCHHGQHECLVHAEHECSVERHLADNIRYDRPEADGSPAERRQRDRHRHRAGTVRRDASRQYHGRGEADERQS